MEQEIRQDLILGSRCFSNYFWAIFLFIGGLGFILAGFSSYFNVNFLPFANTSELIFIPQGLVMIFYGNLGGPSVHGSVCNALIKIRGNR